MSGQPFDPSELPQDDSSGNPFAQLSEFDPSNPDSVIGDIGGDSQVPPGFPDRPLPGEVPVPDLSDEDAWGAVSTPPENSQN